MSLRTYLWSILRYRALGLIDDPRDVRFLEAFMKTTDDETSLGELRWRPSVMSPLFG